MRKILDLGIDEIYINIHHKYEYVVDHFKNSKFKNYIKLFYEKELLGTGGSLVEYFSDFDDDLMVVHSDNFTTDTLSNFKIVFHNRPLNSLATLLAFRTNFPNECGILEVDENNILLQMYEKINNPPSNLANGACYIFSEEAIKLITKNKKNIKDISLDIIPMLYNRINVYETTSYYEDIGSMKKLNKTEEYVKSWRSNS